MHCRGAAGGNVSAVRAPSRIGVSVSVSISAAVVACSVDPVIFTPEEARQEDCAVAGDEDDNGVADCADAVCAGVPACQAPCAGAGLGRTSACAAASCVEIRDKNPASADGVWWIAPSGGPPFEVYCDQTTDGGGWGLVWRNHGGGRGGEASNAELLARAAGGTGDAIVLPQTIDLASAIHQRMYDAYWAAPDREWIKITTLWDGAGTLVNAQHIRVVMRGLTMQAVFAVPVDRCFQAPDRVRVVVNGSVDFGETNIINHYSSDTYGLASTGNLGEDLCGQPATNLISDPAPGATSLYRLDTGGSLNGIRHLFSYVHMTSGRDTSRCLYDCWAGTPTHYDGWVWGVR